MHNNIYILIAIFSCTIASFAIFSWWRKRKKRKKHNQNGRDKFDVLEIFLHDIKSPISSIYSALDIVYNHPDVSEDLKKYIKIVTNNIDRLNTLLSYYSEEAGEKIPLRPVNINIGNITQFLKDTFAEELEMQGTKLRINTSDFNFFADEAKLLHALNNIILNAKRYTKGGDIRISARSGVIFRISDSGPGMPPHIATRSFNRGVSTDENRKGLGLYIVKKMVEAHGGEVWLEYSDKGTTIGFFLPQEMYENISQKNSIKPEAEKKDINQKYGPKPEAEFDSIADFGELGESKEKIELSSERRAKSVLVIDDEPEQIELMKDILSDLNVTVIAAEEGYKGLKLAEKEKPSLIFLDILMPGASGFDILSKIKGNPTLKNTPVVVVSNVMGMKRGKTLGADDYIVKPFKKKEITELVRKYLSDMKIKAST